MKCISPVRLTNKSGNREWIPKYFGDHIDVPCGKCLPCMVNMRNAWIFRLTQELDVATSAYFITFTYDDEHLIYGDRRPTVCKEEVKQFLHDFRNAQEKEHQKDLKARGIAWKDRKLFRFKRVKYYLVSEYGEERERPHYHMVLFNVPLDSVTVERLVRDTWKKCSIVHVRHLNGRLISYVTKYMLKQFFFPEDYEKDGIEPTFRLVSKGLGIDFTNKYTIQKWFNETGSATYPVGRYRYTIPRYYREKLWKNFMKVKYKDEPEFLEDLFSVPFGQSEFQSKNRRKAEFADLNKQIIEIRECGGLDAYKRRKRERYERWRDSQIAKLDGNPAEYKRNEQRRAMEEEIKRNDKLKNYRQ